MSNQNLPAAYYGRILNAKYSRRLKNCIAEWIRHFQEFDQLGSPAMPYISAWQENQNIIWYEFVSRRFIHLLGCDYADASEMFRNSVSERHIYTQKGFGNKLQEQILNYDEVRGRKSELRAEVKNSGAVDAVYKISAADGKTYWLKDQAELASFESDKIYISLGNLTIVTKEMEAEEHLKKTQKALKKSEQKFRQLAIRDNLTGLYNTRYLYKALSAMVARIKSTGRTFSLVFMDLDNFKHVVDSHGHLNASKALQEIASILKATLKSPAYGVAYGGDEFVLVLPGYDKQRAIQMAETVRSRIKENIYLKKTGLKVHISASFGVSTYPDDANNLTELLALADQAMFNVKERGKDSVCGISYAEKREAQGEADFFSYDCNP